MQISEQKTGELVRLAMALGGLAGGGSRSLLAAMDRFGTLVGVALQMRNDLDELASLISAKADVRDDDLRNSRVTWPWVWLASVDALQAKNLSRRPPVSRDESFAIAQSVLPQVASVGESAIGALLDRELRLLGEHILGLESFDSLERVLEPIRYGKSSSYPTKDCRDVCNR
jgi:geranylgeranyl pyrophosphate synthase